VRPGAAGIEPFGPAEFRAATGVSRETCARFEIYAERLRHWARAINLVSRDSLDDLWRRHFLDSAQLLSFLPPAPPERPLKIVDLGSGAGFPGLVLAILGAGEVELIEADRKKAAFLREVLRATGTRAIVRPARIESLAGLEADVVTARACAPLDRLLDYAAPLLAPRGVCLFLKGKQVDRELTALRKGEKIAVERFASRSDPTGVILLIGGVKR
jgi:16S rRNA (guanine527-N7)-methyltransferase